MLIQICCYMPSRDYKKFTQSLKKYMEHRVSYSCLKSLWAVLSRVVTISRSSGCMEAKFNHVEQLFDYVSAVRKVMYTTMLLWHQFQLQNSYQKGAFPNENALLKLLYLRITELYKKWNGSKVQNLAMVRNQLVTNDKIKTRIEKYEFLIWRRFWPPFSFWCSSALKAVKTSFI